MVCCQGSAAVSGTATAVSLLRNCSRQDTCVAAEQSKGRPAYTRARLGGVFGGNAIRKLACTDAVSGDHVDSKLGSSETTSPQHRGHLAEGLYFRGAEEG